MPTLWHTSGRFAVQILLELLMICTHTICNPMYLGVIEMSSMDVHKWPTLWDFLESMKHT